MATLYISCGTLPDKPDLQFVKQITMIHFRLNVSQTNGIIYLRQWGIRGHPDRVLLSSFNKNTVFSGRDGT